MIADTPVTDFRRAAYLQTGFDFAQPSMLFCGGYRWLSGADCRWLSGANCRWLSGAEASSNRLFDEGLDLLGVLFIQVIIVATPLNNNELLWPWGRVVQPLSHTDGNLDVVSSRDDQNRHLYRRHFFDGFKALLQQEFHRQPPVEAEPLGHVHHAGE